MFLKFQCLLLFSVTLFTSAKASIDVSGECEAYINKKLVEAILMSDPSVVNGVIAKFGGRGSEIMPFAQEASYVLFNFYASELRNTDELREQSPQPSLFQSDQGRRIDALLEGLYTIAKLNAAVRSYVIDLWQEVFPNLSPKNRIKVVEVLIDLTRNDSTLLGRLMGFANILATIANDESLPFQDRYLAKVAIISLAEGSYGQISNEFVESVKISVPRS